MIRSLLRWLGLAFLLGAVIAAIVDAAKSIAASQLVLTPVGNFLTATGIIDMDALQDNITQQYSADLWSVIDSWVFHFPLVFMFGILAVALYIMGYRSPKPFEFLSH